MMQTSMSWVGFEPNIPVFEQAKQFMSKTVRPLWSRRPSPVSSFMISRIVIGGQADMKILISRICTTSCYSVRQPPVSWLSYALVHRQLFREQWVSQITSRRSHKRTSREGITQHRRIDATENLTVVFPCPSRYFSRNLYAFPNNRKNQLRNWGKKKKNKLEHIKKNYRKVFKDPNFYKKFFKISF
jgi:hypothetical protein